LTNEFFINQAIKTTALMDLLVQKKIFTKKEFVWRVKKIRKEFDEASNSSGEM